MHVSASTWKEETWSARWTSKTGQWMAVGGGSEKKQRGKKGNIKRSSICQKEYHNCRNKWFTPIILESKWYLLGQNAAIPEKL